MEKHKAIFKGIICENLYEVNYSRRALYLDYYSSHNRSNLYIQEDTIGRFDDYLIKKIIKIIGQEEIWSGVISRPVLEVGEEIYINDLDVVVEITRKYRTTNDEIIYETRHIINVSDTEATESTRLDVVDRWFQVSYPSYSMFDQLKSEFIAEEVIEEEPMERTEYIPPWEREENKKKENTWFGWFSKRNHRGVAFIWSTL